MTVVARRWRTVTLLLVVALPALVAGCGGDDDSGDAGRRGDGAKPAFVVEYERVTAAFEARADRVRRQGQQALGSGGAAVLAVYDDLLDASREAHDGYDDIRSPAELDPYFEKLVDRLAEQIATLEAVVDAAGRADEAALSEELTNLGTVVVEVTNARRSLDRQLEDYV